MHYHVIQNPFLPLMTRAQDPQRSADLNQINFRSRFFHDRGSCAINFRQAETIRNSVGSHVLHGDHLSVVVLVSVSFFFHMDRLHFLALFVAFLLYRPLFLCYYLLCSFCGIFSLYEHFFGIFTVEHLEGSF